MKKILLTRGLITIVDDLDYIKLIKFNWFASKTENTFYVARDVWDYKNKKSIRVYAHQTIMNFKNINHIDGNGLNNQRSNLEVVTHKQNIQRRTRKNKNNTSGFPGVRSYKNNKWVSYIKVNYKYIHLGIYLNIDDAIKARQKAEKKFFYGN